MADPKRQATALSYGQDDNVPTVVATGHGETAERIIALAEEAGVPVRQDPILAQAIGSLELGSEVPAELYIAVAEALIWAWRLDQKKSS